MFSCYLFNTMESWPCRKAVSIPLSILVLSLGPTDLCTKPDSSSKWANIHFHRGRCHSPGCGSGEHSLPGDCVSWHSSLLSLGWNHFVVRQMKMRVHTSTYKACTGIGKIFSLLSSDCILFGLSWFTIGINHLIRQANSHSSVNQLMALL